MFKKGIIDYKVLAGNGLRNGLVAYWKLDVDSTTQVDATGNGHTLTGTDTTYTASGKINGGTSFNGTTAYYQTPDFAYNMTTSFTYNIWANLTDYANTNSFINHDKGLVVPVSRGVLFRTAPTTGELVGLRVTSGGTAIGVLVSPAGFGIGTFKMATYTFDNTVGSKLYINGVVVASDTVLTSGNDCTAPLTVGTGDALNPPSSLAMKGVLDEPGVWNRALTQTEITALYNSGAGLSYDSFTT